MLWLDFDERYVQQPMVYIGVVNQWGSTLNMMCVRNNGGGGGKVLPLGVDGGVGLKLMRYM